VPSIYFVVQGTQEMNQKQLLLNQFNSIYLKSGLLIIGDTGTGKTTALIQILDSFRDREDYRFVIFSTDERISQNLYQLTDQHIEHLTRADLQRWTHSATSWLWLNEYTFPMISLTEMRQQFCENLKRVIDEWSVRECQIKTIFVIDQPWEFPSHLVSLINTGIKDSNNVSCILVTQNIPSLTSSCGEVAKVLVKNLTHRLVFCCNPPTSERLAVGSKLQLRVLSSLPRGQAVMFQRNKVLGRVQINIV